jgi:hypothetical protein
LPDLLEVEDALHRSKRISDNWNRIREAVIAQQQALAEQRARVVKGDYYEDDYNGLHDDYKGSGGFAGGDAKKRRGVSSTHEPLQIRTHNVIESCTAWTLSQLQPSGNSGMEERTRRCTDPLQCVWATLCQIDAEIGRE